MILYEKKDRLGGQVLSAAREFKGGENLLALIAYYEGPVKKHKIKVHLGMEFNKKICRQEWPDVVVVATGAYIEKPAIPGIDKPLVSMAYDVLEAGFRVTGKKIVVIEGGKVGLITAEHFASQGNDTWIVTGERRVDADVSTTFKWRHAAWVKEFNIKVMTEAKVLEVRDNGLTVLDSKGNSQFVEADKVIVAGPRKSNQGLFPELDYLSDEIYLVGDSVIPRYMD